MKKKSSRTIKTPIEKLKAGKSSPNCFQSDYVNQFVEVLNLVKKMEGRGGITIHLSDSNFIIDGGGVSGVVGRGFSTIWNAETAYTRGSIVRYREEVVLSPTVSTVRWGTFEALSDLPAGTAAPAWPENAFWGMHSIGIGYERNQIVCENSIAKTIKIVNPPPY